jgi:hypothetical protein
VPGNFHISTHAFNDIVMALSTQNVRLDFSYKINHLSFGGAYQFAFIKDRFTDMEIMHPLDGTSVGTFYNDDGQP